MKNQSVSWKRHAFRVASALILGILASGQSPTRATTDAARVVKYAQNDIVPVKGRPTYASEMAKRWFKSQQRGPPPIKQPLALGAEASRFWVPQENGAEKGDSRKCLTYMLSGIAFGVVARQ
jgi:uracil-DNA glycosylase